MYLPWLVDMSNEIGAEQLEKTAEISRRQDWFPAKWRLRNERRNSILMTRHYPDLGGVSDWLKRISRAARQIRSIPQIRVVTRHEYRIFPIVPERRHFAGKPVIASRVSAVFSRYEPNPLNCELRTFMRYMVLSLWLIGYCKAAKEKDNKINENCETAIKTNDIRKLQNLKFKKGKSVCWNL